MKERLGSVQCSQCDRWSHSRCTNLVPEALKNLWDTHDATGHHWWACDGCTRAYMTLTKRMMAYERDMADLRREVASSAAGTKEANDKVDKVAKDVEEVKKNRKEDRSSIIAEATKRMSAELRERENKQDSIVLHGLNEPPLSVKGRARRDIDLTSIQELFDDMDVEADSSSDIKFSFRIGELKEDVCEKPRPFCVTSSPLRSRTGSSRPPRTWVRATTSTTSVLSPTSRCNRGRRTRT